MARAGSISSREKVNPILSTPVKNDERLRRIKTVASWLEKHVQIQDKFTPFWAVWLPREPAHKVATSKIGSRGAIAALTFRILEDAGLKPRFAAIHNHAYNPFIKDIPSAVQFQQLAVVVEDENGKSHWLVPGIPHDPDNQPPKQLQGHQALVMERWWADRESGSGRCEPETELTFSCQISTPEPVEVKLVTIE